MWEIFALFNFLQEKYQCVWLLSGKHSTSWPLNKLVKLTMLGTTGPCLLTYVTKSASTKTLLRTEPHQIKTIESHLRWIPYSVDQIPHFTEFIIIGFIPALYSYFKSLNNEINKYLLYVDLLQDK